MKARAPGAVVWPAQPAELRPVNALVRARRIDGLVVTGRAGEDVLVLSEVARPFSPSRPAPNHRGWFGLRRVRVVLVEP